LQQAANKFREILHKKHPPVADAFLFAFYAITNYRQLHLRCQRAKDA
jgi:hypothetical protein